MGNTRIVDLRHYLTPAGAMADMPSRARSLAEYFASIVVDATFNTDEVPTVRCRRRPKHRRCVGTIMSYPAADDLDRIYWYCPVCDDNGLISGWQNTRWDGFAEEQPRGKLRAYAADALKRLKSLKIPKPPPILHVA